METADVVIIGAGFAGAATAYHLTRRGVRNVLVLEREAVAGVHASGRNAALAFQVLSDAAEARLAVEGAHFIAIRRRGFPPCRCFGEGRSPRAPLRLGGKRRGIGAQRVRASSRVQSK